MTLTLRLSQRLDAIACASDDMETRALLCALAPEIEAQEARLDAMRATLNAVAMLVEDDRREQVRAAIDGRNVVQLHLPPPVGKRGGL